MKNAVLVNNTTQDQLTETILNGFKSQLDELKQNFQPKEPDDFLTRKETSALLKISLVSLWDWSKKGILKPYKIANRTYYSRNQITEQLFNSNK
jgi:helix-turn-helix protein